MIGTPPRFPAFEDWANMSEDEQDALLGRMEAARRTKSWLAIGFVCAVAIVAGVAFAAYFGVSNWF